MIYHSRCVKPLNSCERNSSVEIVKLASSHLCAIELATLDCGSAASLVGAGLVCMYLLNLHVCFGESP